MTHIDRRALISNFSLSKIDDFGQVQPLWWKIKYRDWTNETFLGKD